MSKPRLGKHQAGPAQSSASRDLVGSMADPNNNELLASFLGAAHIAEDRESGISVSIKLMNKVSETTKLKALNDLQSRCGDVPDDSLAPYVYNIIETIRLHSGHESTQIRTGVFSLLTVIASRGKAVKAQLAPCLATLMGPWLQGMSDMEASVKQCATEAFHQCFAVDKRPVVIQKYSKEASTALIELLKEVGKEPKPLLDDATDPKANAVFSSFGALVMLMKHSPDCHKGVIDFVSSQAIVAFLPQRPMPKSALLLRTPKARSAVLQLLREVADVCPLDAKRHTLIGNALCAAISDTDCNVCLRCWELLLTWCRKYPTDIVQYFPPKFLDVVIDSFVLSDVPAALEVVFKSLLPFVACVSKDARCGGGVVDEFCGALVEKLTTLRETPNVAADEMSNAWRATLELWELHCIRKAESNEISDSLELFAVILNGLVEIADNAKKSLRYLPSLAEIVAGSINKACRRNAEILTQLLATICHRKGTLMFSAIPLEGEEAKERPLRTVASYVLAALLGLQSSEDGTNIRTLVQGAAAELLAVLSSNKEYADLSSLIVQLHQSWVPPMEVRNVVWRDVLDAIFVTENEYFNINHHVAEKVVRCFLQWVESDQEKDVRISELQKHSGVTNNVITQRWAKNVIRTSFPSDPSKLVATLVDHLTSSEPFDVDCDEADRIAQHCLDTALDIDERARHRLRVAVSNVLLNLVPANVVVSSERQEGSDDSDEEGDESRDTSSDDAAAETLQDNQGPELALRVEQWCHVLSKASPLGRLLQFDVDSFAASSISSSLSRTLGLIAPKLFPEQLVAEKAMRLVLGNAQCRSECSSQDNDDDEAADTVLDCLAAKAHWVKADAFKAATDKVQRLFGDYELGEAQLNAISASLWKETFQSVSPLGAASQLSFSVPFLSPTFALRCVLSHELWEGLALDTAIDEIPIEQFEGVFDGSYSLSRVRAAQLTPFVRCAQMVKLIDMKQLIAIASCDQIVKLLPRLLQLFALKEIFPTPIQHTLLHRIIGPCLLHIRSKEAAAELVKSISLRGLWSNYLLVTAASAYRHLTITNEGFALLASTLVSCIVGVAIIPEVATAANAAKWQHITMAQVFEHLCAIAHHIEDDVLIALSKDETRSIEAILSSTDDPRKARRIALALLIYRHIDTRPPLMDTTAQSIGALCSRLAQIGSSIEGLTILGELMGSRLVNRVVYNDICRQANHLFCQVYLLHHLPSNGKLGLRTETSSEVPLASLQCVVDSAKSILRGLKYHATQDDVLRSSIQLAVFDIVCECVMRLRTVNAANSKGVDALVALVASTSEFMQELSPTDVHPLRASEKSLEVIGNMFSFVHQWCVATSLSRMEAIGVANVRTVVSCVTMLVQLVLMRCKRPLPLSIVATVIKKPSIKPLRKADEFSTVDVCKLAKFRTYHNLLRKATKQRLHCQMVLLAYALVLSSEYERPFVDDDVKETKRRLFEVLDVILALSMAPLHPEATSDTSALDNSLLFSSTETCGEQLGYDIAALSKVSLGNDLESFSSLGRGALSVLTLLLLNNTLSSTKDWTETIDKRLREQLLSYCEDHVSPALIQENLTNVLSHSANGEPTFDVDENLSVTVSTAARTIEATFQLDETNVKIKISLPKAYPLKAATVVHDTKVVQGVSSEKWRAWILKMSVMLFSGSSNLWDCVQLFGQNIKKHFDGVEPCPICYAVVSSVNNRLPEMRCAVCRNSLFHSSCLYTWWGNSGQTSCPMCRSPWVS